MWFVCFVCFVGQMTGTVTMRGFFSRLRNRLRRELAARLARRSALWQSDVPVISFTFDDFPRSALTCAGALLREHGFAGTYFTSLGLMGSTRPTGRIFDGPDLQQALTDGHELGCHTFSHCHAWDTQPRRFEAELRKNQEALTTRVPGGGFQTLSYPISNPRPGNKRAASRHYVCSRGGGQTFNTGQVDLNYLRSFFLEQSRDDFATVRRVIDANRNARGWLIFSTHDVAEQPTPFGVTPDFFAQTLQCAIASGARILPVIAAVRRIAGAFPPGSRLAVDEPSRPAPPTDQLPAKLSE